ncbi:unnamed protein product [Phyllotreta striolata]|uniref:NADH-cytochrome b5 reductase n=1 Tax=Phyllotreta striolata TaxID=444603 RepID=A0A9N9TNA7_PHYSR|nr:unnamed protein product [Phyllotreta striolata]
MASFKFGNIFFMRKWRKPINGVGIVVTSFVVYKLLFFKVKGKKHLLKDPNEKYKLPLIKKDIISHDTRLFRFGLPEKDMVLGLPIGKHIQLSARINDELVIRSYTPVSSDDDEGYVDLVVKVYFKDVHPKFPLGGKMTQYLEQLKIGDTIDVRGPTGRIEYHGHGKFTVVRSRKDPPDEYNVSKVGLIAGGVGITPILQLVRHILKDPSDKTQCALLFANQTEEDILLREELEQAAKEHPDRFKFWYTLDRPPADWKYSSGFITCEMLDEHLYPAGNDTVTLICGPPAMVKFAIMPNLTDKLEHDKNRIIVY